MSPITNAVSHLTDVQQLFPSPSFSARTNQLQTRSQTLNNANFTFLTSEGDRVSLSTSSEVNTSFGTYTFQGLAAGQAVNLQSQHFSSSIEKNLQFLVEGDLNEQEQADIQEFLNSAQTILRALVEGDAEGATKASASLADLDTLSQAALFVRQSTTISVASQSRSTGTSGLADRQTERSLSSSERASTLEETLTRLQEAREKLKLDQEQLLTRLPTLTATLIQSLQRESETTDPDNPPSLLEQIQQRFLDSLLASTEELNPQEETDEIAGNVANQSAPGLSIHDENIFTTPTRIPDTTDTPPVLTSAEPLTII